jgi:hypothetical protein
MKFVFNWKTTAAGAILIGAAVLHQVFGVNIPGFNMDIGAAIAAGLGLITASDAGNSQS